MFLAFTRGRQEHDFAFGIDQDVVFDRVPFLFAAVVGLLHRGILGGGDGPLRAILKVELGVIVRQIQVVGLARWAGADLVQRLVETVAETINPLIGDDRAMANMQPKISCVVALRR